jgi:hypothetical protein
MNAINAVDIDTIGSRYLRFSLRWGEEQREIVRKGAAVSPTKTAALHNHQLGGSRPEGAATRPAVAPRVSALRLGEARTVTTAFPLHV